MFPTFGTGTSTILIDKLSYKPFLPAFLRRPFQRGDVVVCVSPAEPDKVIAKRIRALEGDVVDVDGVNGGYKIPKGHVWVLGDNADASVDSRSFGPVPIGLMKGRIIAMLKPKAAWITQEIPKSE